MLKKTCVSLTVAASFAALLATGSAAADDVLIKKTLDGRCLAPDHPEYWDTKIYVAKTSMDACVASGGKPESSNTAK